jgi:hypothetical protein
MFIQHTPSKEANSFSVSEEILLCLSWNMKVHYHAHKNKLTDTTILNNTRVSKLQMDIELK